MKVAGPPTTRCGSLICDTMFPSAPSRRNMRCNELSTMKIKEPRAVSITAPLETAAGKAACQSSRPVAPSNFVTVTPDITMTLSRPDGARTISGGIGTPLPLIEVLCVRLALQSDTPLPESSANVALSLLTAMMSNRSRERKCAATGKLMSPTAVRQPPTAAIEFAGGGLIPGNWLLRLSVWRVRELSGSVCGCTSITLAAENSPSVFVKGATRQKYLPGGNSVT